MGITAGRLYLAVTKELSDHRQTLPESQRSGGVRMTEVMHPHVDQPGALPDRLPCAVDVA